MFSGIDNPLEKDYIYPMSYYYSDDFAPMATMSDAHREWHLNSGVPMGQPGCPMDACHPPEPDYCDGCGEVDDGANSCSCPEPDGAPIYQWEVTEPAAVYWDGESDFPF